MKPKASAQWRSERLRRDIQPASDLFKKKELKRLSTKKKTVTFDLPPKFSTSELVLCENGTMEPLKPAAHKGRNLTSKSCVNIAEPRIALKPISKRPLACWFVQTGQCDQLGLRNAISLRKCFPVKSILKNAPCSGQFNTSRWSYQSHEHYVLARDPYPFSVSEKQKSNNHRQLSFPGDLDECSAFDNLANSIQSLHISAFSPD
ncbi:hypothetical protein BsWGS_19548 [Bradybaena similaris]